MPDPEYTDDQILRIEIGSEYVTETKPYTVERVRLFRKIRKVIIGDGIEVIGDMAFFDCTELMEIDLPHSLASIGNWAFEGCTGLINIELPNNIKSIRKCAFFGCTALTNIDIPNSITSIGKWAFFGCTALKDPIYLDSKDKGKTLVAWPSASGNIPIPDDVTKIGDTAFFHCTGLTNIALPRSLTSIGDSAFSDCTGLTNIKLPNSIKSIGDSAFSDCTGLTNIKLPNSINAIGKWAFEVCTGLTNIKLPSSIKSIGNNAFRGCTALTNTKLPNNLISIGNSAFEDCNNIEKIEIPDSVKIIGRHAFDGCTKLKEITIPASIEKISETAFANCPELIKNYLGMQRLKDGIKEKNKRHSKTKKLWHYTTIDSFIKILETWADSKKNEDKHKIYASHYNFLNDQNEGFRRLGQVKFAKDYLEFISTLSLIQKNNGEDNSNDLEEKEEFLNKFLDYMKSKEELDRIKDLSMTNRNIENSKRIVANINRLIDFFDHRIIKESNESGPDNKLKSKQKTKTEDKLYDYFLFCMSEAEDDLSQWRAYTHYKDGGISLGINYEEFLKAKEELKNRGEGLQSIDFLPCEYKENELQYLFDQFIAIDENDKIKKRKDRIDEMIKAFFTVKHKSFENEKEWRLIFRVEEKDMDKIVYIGNKPRYAFKLPNFGDMLKCVYISPHGNRAQIRAHLEFLKRKYHLKFEIKDSMSPYCG